ncbi:MAG: 1-(5-phosphoribosyl)-5-[(5-phosphoribosylamino)methylideneamino]imidazole-4-carboxamide isomerase [Methanocorpusculum sp.]|nr:1-(5-phosphoribosyl)-5-[(5-phosphoribosylamino)methylideneamino]imidazole-4-carboxamide isomerase [Methanocorpusculum sp.]
MQIFPAVDILGGQCVQLIGGDRSTAESFGSPLENARRWVACGADALHVINLDGAFSASSVNAACIREVVDSSDVFIQLGGGIRSISDARGWLDCGVSRIILSTFAVREPDAVRALACEFGSERIMAGVDARGGNMAVEGWTASAGDYVGWAERFEALGAGSLLYTNIDVEGRQAGIDPAPVQRLIDAVSVPVVVSGGVSSPADVRTLNQLGAAGCVLGSALYSGKISFADAQEAVYEKS